MSAIRSNLAGLAAWHGSLLPTLADVEGYERREPATWKHITAGYPRFVRNALVSQAAQQAAQQFGRTGSLFPLASRRAADRILAWTHVTDAHIDAVGDWVLVSFPEGPASEPFAKFVQHTGALISSRQAEAHLAGCSADPAETVRALEQVRAVLSPYLASVKPADILVALAGMNAVAAGIAAVNDVQRPRGKRVWIQLGWLYVDSTRLFEKATDTQHVFVPDVTDLGAVERLLAQGDVAGVFTEIPNNPQLETADVYALRRLCDQFGAKLVLDPSSVGLASVDVLPPRTSCAPASPNMQRATVTSWPVFSPSTRPDQTPKLCFKARGRTSMRLMRPIRLRWPSRL